MEYRNVNHDPPKMHQPDLNLMVHFIDEPEKDPYPLNDKFYSYYDILWYLNDQNIIKAPELWIRENAQKFQIPLPNGLAECWRWKCAVAGEKLSGSVMYGLSMIGRSNYIVALVHAGQDEEFLMSIDVPIFGAEPCSSCNPSCTTLGEHLTNIWTGRYRVFHASKLGNPECSALGKALNSIEFTIRMNELYIRAEKL
ncbi:hypothetical protein FRB91_003803 [Serendipita sp. 411]|nr:hypothetical protein FRC16_004020 [Serendipita sp. 398]KAG8832925.1 hypothetical protein FRC18_004398 [Serendipita sp. 400]KAG8854265.1 hypothetical protein FRB91_003803 [Serendipita sp. 411]